MIESTSQDATVVKRKANRVRLLELLVDSRRNDKLVKALIGILVMILCLYIVAGSMNLLLLLYHALQNGWEASAEHTIVGAITILALLEIIRTLQSYLEIGRVKVTFILDAALVVLIGELIGLWHKSYTLQEVVLSLGVIALLVLLRVVTAKYSPYESDEKVSSDSN